MSAPTETILYHVKLPQFIINFKSHIVNQIVPHLQSIKQLINQQQNSEYVNPLIVLLVIGVVLIVIRNLWIGLFGKRENFDVKQSPELNSEVNDLKKQLKAVRLSFSQLVKEINVKSMNPNHQIPSLKYQISQSPSIQLLNNLLPLYTTSLTQNKQLVNYVLESQFQVLKQLKKFKKLYKNSVSSNGRPSTSTIRSKTSDKKIIQTQNGKDRSPLKGNITIGTEAKKQQLKNIEKSSLSEANEKMEKSKDESFIKTVGRSPKPHTKNHQLPKIKRDQQSTQPQANLVQKPLNITTPQIQQKNEDHLLPVTPSPQSPTIYNKSKVEVQSIVKETQFTEQIQTSDNIQTTIQKNIFQSTIKLQTVIQSINPSAQQLGDQIESNSTQMEEPQIFVAPKLPQIKKMIPPTTRPGGKRAPPPPPRK